MNDEFKQTEVRSRRDPESIRQDIRRTRGEMDGTVDELVDRLSVGNLVDEVWHRFRHKSGAMDGVLKDHPIPLALIGLGLGWLVVEQATGGSSDAHEGPDRRGSRSRHNGQSTPSGVYGDSTRSSWEDGSDNGDSGEGIRDRVGQKASDMKHRATDMKDQVSDRASELKDEFTDAASDLKHRMGDSFSSMKDSASDLKESGRDAGRRVQSGVKSMMTDHPLTAGGIAFGIGLASGLAVPSSSFEDRKLGKTSDRLKEQARSVGRDAADAAGDMGQKAAHAVVEEAHNRLEEHNSEEDSPSSGEHDRDPTGQNADGPDSGVDVRPGAPQSSL